MAANGGGPEIVYDEDGSIAMESLRGKHYDGQIDPADIARGADLFRLNCASCHNFTGRGGALSSGKYAPYLDPANEQEIYQAMLTGPQNMPKCSRAFAASLRPASASMSSAHANARSPVRIPIWLPNSCACEAH